MPRTFRRLFEGPDEIDYAPDPMGRVGAGMQEIHDPTDDPRGNELFQDFREAWAEGHDLPELFGDDGMLDIKEPVGPAARNRRPDVAKLETFLDALGEHDAARTEGPTGFYGIGFEDNLKAYQARSGLTPDGLVNPDGETIGRIKQDLTATLGPGALGGGDDGADGMEPGARTVPVQSAGKPRIGSPRPSPTHRQAERTSGQKLAKAVSELDQLEAKYRDFLKRAKMANEGSRVARHLPPLAPFAIKIDKAIKAYERYLDGTGGVVNYDPKWLLRHKVIENSEQRVHGHFRNWLLGLKRSDTRREPLHQSLLKLKQNKSVVVEEPWQALIRWGPEHRFDDQRLIVGNSNVNGRGTLNFARKGNTIEVTGEVLHRVRDDFTFTPGRVNHFPFGEKLVHNDMLWLQANGRAKPFTTQSTWRRSVVARLRIERDPRTGKERIAGFVEEPRWSDLK